MDLLPRTVLSAPASPAELTTLNSVILVVSVLSILGAGWIILSFILFDSVRAFRHQLILGLAISDLWMAINFLSSTAINLSGHSMSDPAQKGFCSFNGFATQLFVVQTDYWVLLIAICTFLILANFKRQSDWIQEHRIILWCLPWGFSTLWAAIGLGVAGYGDIGAWCWFTSDTVRLLVNFIPRWIIIIAMLGIYLRLYVIIYRAHTRFASLDEEASGARAHHSIRPETDSVSSTSRIGRPVHPLEMEESDGKLSPPKEEEMDWNSETNTATSNKGGSNGARARMSTHARIGQPSPILKKMARQMMVYPLVYMLIWAIPTGIRIYQVITGQPAPFGIATVDKACIVIQGFADAIIYGFNESSLAVWRERFGWNKSRTTNPWR